MEAEGLMRYRIRYMEGSELENNRHEVAINLRKQGYYNMVSAAAILLSFFFFIGYFIQDPSNGQQWFGVVSGTTIFSLINLSSLILSA